MVKGGGGPLSGSRGQGQATAWSLWLVFSFCPPRGRLGSPNITICYGRRSQCLRFPEAAADIVLTRTPAQGSLELELWALCPEKTPDPGTGGHKAECEVASFHQVFVSELDWCCSVHYLFKAELFSAGAQRLGRDCGNCNAP